MRVTQGLLRSARQMMEIPVSVLHMTSITCSRGGSANDVRSDVFGEPFPYEDSHEDGPEEDTALPLGEDASATVHGIEELHLGHEERIHRPRRVDEVVTCETDETIANKLGRNEPVSRNGRRAISTLCERRRARGRT